MKNPFTNSDNPMLHRLGANGAGVPIWAKQGFKSPNEYMQA